MNFSEKIISWYQANKRDLPWRNTTDPYLIWLSEIILQQTRVEQGMPYYLRFSEKYPTVQNFAAASEDEILNLWQGLGYYSRGRNMLKTAQKVILEHGGVFPNQYKELIKLTGIGEYTAAAISSFSANEAQAVVDGNVYRLLSRYFGIATPINTGKGKKEFQEVANQLLDHQQAGEYNQAMIEFGALKCKPKNPDCFTCPLQSDCYAYEHQQINNLPVKLKTLKVKERYFYYFLVIKDDKILMKRRDNEDIWAGLHDLPLIEHTEFLDFKDLALKEEFKNWFPENVEILSISKPVKHVLTHQRIFGTFIEISNINEAIVNENKWLWLKINDLEQYAQPKLIFAFIKNLAKLNKK